MMYTYTAIYKSALVTLKFNATLSGHTITFPSSQSSNHFNLPHSSGVRLAAKLPGQPAGLQRAPLLAAPGVPEDVLSAPSHHHAEAAASCAPEAAPGVR